MAKAWRAALERMEDGYQRRKEWESTHPPITQISVEDADSRRKLIPVGEKCVTCNLPCHGVNVPEKYTRIRNWINVFARGIKVEGYDKPEEGRPYYPGSICNLNGKICVATDEKLRKAVER